MLIQQILYKRLLKKQRIAKKEEEFMKIQSRTLKLLVVKGLQESSGDLLVVKIELAHEKGESQQMRTDKNVSPLFSLLLFDRVTS